MERPPSKLPETPGVYIFSKGRNVLYIGKATNLRDRVRSYFSKDLLEMRGPGLMKMLETASAVRFQETDTVLEALILEARLIKKFQPPFNTKEKSDKSFYYVAINKDDFPAIVVMRGKELSEKMASMSHTFGPFPKATELREAMRIIRKIFPYRDDKCVPGSGRPCFNAQIGLCPGVCAGTITGKEYAGRIREIVLFFEGKKKAIEKDLTKQMKVLVAEERFEEASVLRNRLFALTHINDIALLKRRNEHALDGFRVEAFDVAHISGTHTVGAMTVVVGGEAVPSEYKRFILRGAAANKSDDTANLREILERRFAHPEWGAPDLVVIDGGTAQRSVAEKFLARAGIRVAMVSVVKDERHRPKDIMGESKIVRDYRHEILLANSEAHRFAVAFHKTRRDKIPTRLRK